jgi:hypothetical protein
VIIEPILVKAPEITVRLRLLTLKKKSGATVCENRERDYARREMVDELGWLITLLPCLYAALIRIRLSPICVESAIGRLGRC